MSIKTKDFYSTREAAEKLNVAISTIQSWSDSGVLKAWATAGGHRRISVDSVEDILEQQNLVSNKNDKKDEVSITIVEDNEQEQSIYKQQFEIWNIEANVTITKDGYEGLINIGKTSPKIIITDLMMPNMDGFELVKAVKNNADLKNSVVIVASALTNDEIRIRGGLPPDVIVFSKPLPFNELELLIRKQLRQFAA